MSNKVHIALDRMRDSAERYLERKAEALNQELMLLDQIAEALYRLEDLTERLDGQHRQLVSPANILRIPNLNQERKEPND